MAAKMDRFSTINSNPMLSVAKDGTVLYSNKAAEPLLHKWGVKIGEKLPRNIEIFVQRAISRNNPEKIEVKVGKRIYLVVLHPLPEQESVNVSGFDISDKKELEEQIPESETKEEANLELEDIIDIPAIQSLMDDFYRLAHISMGLIDLKGNVLASVGWQDICTQFHKVNPEAFKHCVESDTKLSTGVFPGESKLYKCKNNMWDVETPIMVNGKHVANIFSGQFFFEDEQLNYELFRSQAQKYGFSEEEYISALEKVPRLSREAVGKKMSFFMKLTNILSQLSHSNFKLSKSLVERNTLVDALLESEEKYRNIVETANEGIWVVNAEDKTIYVNNKMAEMLENSPEEIIGKLMWDFIDQGNKSVFIPNIEKRHQGTDGTYELKLINKDGSPLWTLVNTKSFFDKNNKSAGFIGMLTDITKRKQEEHRIRRYNRILEGINRIFSNVVQAKTEEELGEACLSVALEVTGSEFGFIIEMGADGLLHDVAKSKLAWEQCLMYDKTGHINLPRDYVVHGLYGSVIINEKSFFTNDPQSHPDSSGLPEGHPPIMSFLGVPLILDGKIIGSIAVANREGGYSYEQQEDLEAIAPAVTQALQRKRSEEALELSNLYNRSLIEASLDPLVTIGHDGKITDVNGATEQVTGYSRIKLIGTDFSDYFTEPERAHKGYQQVFTEGIVRDYPLEIQHKDGHITPVLYNASVYRDENGKVIGVFAAARDIAEIQKAEEKIQTLANVVESSEDAIITKSLDGIITSWNKGAEQVYGYLAEEVLGKGVSILEPDNFKGETNHLIEKIKQGERVQHYESTRLKKNGTIIDISVTLSPIFDVTGKLVAISAIARDFTERRKTEEALQESEERFRALVMASSEMIYRVSPDWSEMLYFYGRGFLANTESPNLTWLHEYVLPEDQQRVTAIINEAIRTKSTYQTEHRVRLADGSVGWIFSRAVPMLDSNGEIVEWFGAANEITERKKVEEALRESEERLRLLGDNLPDSAVYQYILEPDGSTHFQYFSAGIERLIGISVSDALCDLGMLHRQIQPEYLERFFEAEAYSARELSDFDIELPLKLLNGQAHWIRLHSRPRRLPEGRIIWDGVLTDITEQKRAEEALKKARDTLEEKVKERTAELEKAYNSLKESEKGLAEAQKMAHIGNWDWDLVTGEVYWSEETYRIYGHDPEKPGAAYEELLHYIHPDDRDYVDNAIKKGLNGKPSGIDYRIILGDGDERTVHVQQEIIFNENNIPIRVKGITQDITERKRAEEKLQILANAVESSNDAIITMSLDGIITSWNKAAEQVYGYSSEEILGENVSILEPDDIKGEIKQFSEKIKQGKRIQHYESIRLKKDNTIINISVTLSPIFDVTGKLVAISGIVRDITDRIKAEEALLESEARLRRFYESDMVGVFFYNLNGSITEANHKLLDIVGYTREDLEAGRIKWDQITPPEYRQLDEHAMVELKSTGSNTPYEKEYIRKDGLHVPVIVGVATFDQVRNEGIAFVLDITEKKKAEEALANLEIARKKEIHHRIKNNLQVISSLLDLQADKFDNPKVIEAFRESQDRVISMALIHEELYKGEGTDTLNFSEYLKKLAENLFQTYSLSSKNINLNIDLEENAFFDMDIAIPLGIIVNEIVSNSFKHAFPEKEEDIQIKLRREDGERKWEVNKSASFILTISDNGVGIPENLEIEDLGSLGLQLITTLVDQLEGELELKRGSGTEFTIRFTVTEKENLT